MSGRSELARLTEGQRVDGVRLHRDEAAALNSTGLVSAQPDEEGWRVTAAYAVGAITCGDLTVRVRSKVGTVQVLRLLARAHGIRGLTLDDALVGVNDDPDLNVVLARMFGEEGVRALAAGPMRGYRTEDQSLTALRGRVRLRDQELRRFGQLVPIEVTVDEWTMDTEENRLIRSACRRLRRLGDVPAATARQLLAIDRVVTGAQLLPRGAPIPRWTRSRLNHRLHSLLHLAELVLRQRTIEHRVGDVEVRGFVLSMSWLFETLVAQILTEQRGDPHTLAQQTRKLDERGELTIKPDLLFTSGGVVVGVADTKYKILDDRGRFPNADAYQLVTYCARLGLSTGHLIYASGEPCPEPYGIVGAGIELFAHAVELTEPLAGIERQVAIVRDEIHAAARVVGRPRYPLPAAPRMPRTGAMA